MNQKQFIVTIDGGAPHADGDLVAAMRGIRDTFEATWPAALVTVAEKTPRRSPTPSKKAAK